MSDPSPTAAAVIDEALSFPSTDDATRVHARLWMPATGTPRGIVQLVHGMSEHIERYAPSRAGSRRRATSQPATTISDTARPRRVSATA